MVGGRCFAGIYKQTKDRVFPGTSNAGDRANAHSLAKQAEDFRAGFFAELVHKRIMLERLSNVNGKHRKY